jgi:hypothetical protein
MNWWDYLNPFTYLGNAAGKIVADGWTAAMLGIWNAGLWLLKLVLASRMTSHRTCPRTARCAGFTLTPLWIAGSIILTLLMIQLGIAAFRRDLSVAGACAHWLRTVRHGVGRRYRLLRRGRRGGLTRALMGLC